MLVVVTLLVVGAVVRVAYAFPVHKYAPDADSLNMGLRAMAIRGGDLVVFFSAGRIGALEAYLHAVVFSLLGPTRTAISIVPIAAGCATLLVFYLFVRELFGARIAALSLLFLAIPSPTYLAWTYMPNSYPETVLFCATTLWLSARIARRGAGGWWPVALGISIGLGWWNSAMTLGCSAPAFLWLLLSRRERRSHLRLAGGTLAGFLVGALPWISFYVFYGMATLRANFPPASGGPGALATARRFATGTLPELLAGANPFYPLTPVTPLARALKVPALVAGLLALASLPFAPRLSRGRVVEQRGSSLLILVGSTVAALFVFSASGQAPGPTVRYVLPIVFVVAAALGLLVDGVARRSRAMAGVLTAVVLAFNLSGYYWPWTAERRTWAENARHDELLLAFLESRGVQWVCGDYWIVYPLNFLSGLRVRGIPYQSQFDFYRYGDTLSGANRFALLSTSREDLLEWTRRAAFSGSIVSPAPGYFAFLPEAAAAGSPARVLANLRASRP